MEETEEEFDLASTTIRKDLYFLGNKGYGEEGARNRKLFLKAKVQLEKNKRNR